MHFALPCIIIRVNMANDVCILCHAYHTSLIPFVSSKSLSIAIRGEGASFSFPRLTSIDSVAGIRSPRNALVGRFFALNENENSALCDRFDDSHPRSL